MPIEISVSPRQTRGSHFSFCASLPKRSITRTGPTLLSNGPAAAAAGVASQATA